MFIKQLVSDVCLFGKCKKRRKGTQLVSRLEKSQQKVRNLTVLDLVELQKSEPSGPEMNPFAAYFKAKSCVCKAL